MTGYFHLGLLVIATLVCSTNASGDIVVNFDDLAVNDNDPVPQSYGDNSLFNVSYRELDAFGNAAVVNTSLRFWTNDYGDLQNVVWGSDQIPTRVAEIRFDALTADSLLLNSFDAADWDASANNQSFRVYDGNYNVLFQSTNVDVSDVTRSTIIPNVSANTLILQWDYPWAVAMDNISISAVPEPSSLVMLGVCCGGYFLRRRRAISINSCAVSA